LSRSATAVPTGTYTTLPMVTSPSAVGMGGVRSVGRRQERTAEPAHDRPVPAPRQRHAGAGGVQPSLYVVGRYAPRNRLVTEGT